MRRDRGAALLLVLLLVALLAVMVLEFQRQARVELRAARNLLDDVQAHALLRSGSEVTEQVLAVYSANSIADMKSGASQMKGGELLWKFLFEEETVSIPVPSAVIQGSAGLRGRLQDLYGRFPLGALVGADVEPRRTQFRYFLGHVKEYLLSRENKALESIDPEDVAGSVLSHLDRFDAGDTPVSHMSELYGVDGLTPDVVRAVSPFLDVRKEWKFCVNGRSVPLIMTMQSKSIDEALEIREILRQDPVPEDKDIPNTGELSGLNPEFANSLTTKTSRVEVVLEAEVRGGFRRARAVFAKGDQGQGATGQAAPTGKRFRLVEWAEGWVEDELGEAAPAAAADAGKGAK